MASIGQELKRERELRGISLKEIADSTKINLRFLRALEEEHFDLLPEQFFTRGIIRTYANYLGLDEQNILNTYIESQQAREIHEKSGTDKKADIFEKPESALKKINISKLFIFIVLAIISLIIVMYFIFRKEKSPPPNALKIPPAVQETREKTITLPPLIQEESAAELQGMNIEITVQQETWIEIFADQEMLDSGIKYQGDLLQFNALQEFLIHIGNAGGITYTINGQEGKTFGEPGTVKRDIQITMDNLKDFIAGERES